MVSGVVEGVRFESDAHNAPIFHSSGMSVTYTSVTDTVAFALGSASSIPAVSYFCSYAAMSCFIDFLLQVTLS